MSLPSEIAQRFEVIETHLAHLERQYEQLNEVALEQGRQLARLSALNLRLSQTLETIEQERIKNTPAKPPHYH